MEELLTTEEKKYIERVGRYVQSMGKKQVSIFIEANDYDSKSEISDIEWELVTEFEYDRNLEIPSRFIVILQKIFNYIEQSGKYEYPNDIDGINQNEFSIDLNTNTRELTVRHHYNYYSEDEGHYLEFEEPELMEEWKDQIEMNGGEIPSNGILNARYSGGGDDGSMDGGFDEINQQLPGSMEDFCYNQLSSDFGGWENNEGGQGSFEFNFNEGTIILNHFGNIEQNESNTLFETEY
jgi:hypothetical protein